MTKPRFLSVGEMAIELLLNSIFTFSPYQPNLTLLHCMCHLDVPRNLSSLTRYTFVIYLFIYERCCIYLNFRCRSHKI